MKKTKRSMLFSEQVPVVKVKSTNVELKPDLIIVIDKDQIKTARINSSADLRPIISKLDDLLYELKLINRYKKK